jgi:hypothetical protein
MSNKKILTEEQIDGIEESIPDVEMTIPSTAPIHIINGLIDSHRLLAERNKALEAVARWGRDVITTVPHSDEHTAAVMNLSDTLEKLEKIK